MSLYSNPNEVLTMFSSVLAYVILRYIVVAGLIYFMLWKLFANKLNQRMLSPEKLRKNQIRQEIIQSAKVAVTFTVGAVIMYHMKKYNIGMWYESIEEKGIAYFIFSLGVMAFIGDTYFYWTHRWIHQPRLFKMVHAVHHLSSNPTPFTSMSFSFSEALLNIVVVVLFPLLIPIHFKAYLIYTLIAFIYNVYAHCGYDLLPKNTPQIWPLKYFNSSRDHHLHHSRSHGNYGFYTTLWDRWMGTYITESARKISS